MNLVGHKDQIVFHALGTEEVVTVQGEGFEPQVHRSLSETQLQYSFFTPVTLIPQ